MMTSLFAAMLLCQSGDPSGFTDALNAARAERGLAAVAYSPGAVEVAAVNNSRQTAYGLGHHVLGGLGQVAGMGPWDASGVLWSWLASPSHAAILLDPNLACVGYACSGWYHTASTSSAGIAGWQVGSGTYWVYPHWTYYRPIRGRGRRWR